MHVQPTCSCGSSCQQKTICSHIFLVGCSRFSGSVVLCWRLKLGDHWETMSICLHTSVVYCWKVCFLKELYPHTIFYIWTLVANLWIHGIVLKTGIPQGAVVKPSVFYVCIYLWSTVEKCAFSRSFVRKQYLYLYIGIGSHFMDPWDCAEAGIPQGAVVRPWVFYIYIHLWSTIEKCTLPRKFVRKQYLYLYIASL